MATADSVAAEAQQAYTDAKTLADSALARSDAALVKADATVAGLWGVGLSFTPNPEDVVPGAISKPLLPTTDFSTDVKTAFDYAFNTLNESLQPQVLNYLTAFFPDIAAAIKTGSDQWIIDTIANGRFVPADVEAAIWNRAKERETLEAGRSEQDTINATASRGFSAPTGTLNYTIAATQEELTKKLIGINRDIAIKVFDTANENSKFAIQQAISLRTAFVSALGDFIKTAMAQPNNATEYAKLILQSKTGLYDNAIRLYSAQIDEERMRSNVALEVKNQDRQAFDSNASSLKTSYELNQARARIQSDTAMSAADKLAKIAAAAMATRNSMVSISAGV